jgi:hypothetical protein
MPLLQQEKAGVSENLLQVGKLKYEEVKASHVRVFADSCLNPPSSLSGRTSVIKDGKWSIFNQYYS